MVGAAESIMIGGFSVTGNSPKRVLVRGVGPGLAAYGITGALADPLLRVYDAAATVIAQNDNWETPQTVTGAQTPASASDLAAASASTGDFALKTGSKDAALIVTLAPGAYTAQLSSAATGATGVALIEIYEISQ
jgi:hypothetical protein